MTIIRLRTPHAANLRANDYNEQRLREVKQERCGICFDLWPSSMMMVSDGNRRCPDCFDTRDESVKAEIRAYDSYQIATRQTRPQESQTRLRETALAFVRSMVSASGAAINATHPLSLSRGGAAVTLGIIGGGFNGSDVLLYSSGISDSVAPALTGSSRWDLTLVASGGMQAGSWHLTFNNHTYRNIFSVR